MAKSNKETVLRGLLLGGENRVSDIVVRGGSIAEVRCAGTGKADAGSAESIIAPTLFDIQVNGSHGIDLHDPKLKPEDVRKLTDVLAAQGVSHWVPTLVTNSGNNLLKLFEVLAEARKDSAVHRAVPGFHLEGPYISPKDGPRGAHAKKHVRKPSLREFDKYMKAADGKILYVTLAPEADGAIPFIRGLVRRGVVVSLGHHDADEATIVKAVEAGARMCTHLGNGIGDTIPRHVNPLWPQLSDDRLAASFIPDLHHLPPAPLKTFLRAKMPERSILTSDAVHIAGQPPGKYGFGSAAVELLPTGRICLVGTKLLAGSSLNLLQGVVNVARVTDLGMDQAFACATSVPAKLLGLRHQFILPKAGKTAEFILFDIKKTKNDWRAELRAVYVNGSCKTIPA